MFNTKLFSTLTLGMLLTMTVQAGSKGFTAIFIDIGGSNFFESKVYKTFSAEYPNSKERELCWESRATGGKSFELIIKKAVPKDLTPDIARSIWDGKKEQTRLAQRIISKAKSPQDQRIDGLYVINAKNDHIAIMSLGSRSFIGNKNPSKKISILWDDAHPQQGALAFDIALCKTSHPLDFGFSP